MLLIQLSLVLIDNNMSCPTNEYDTVATHTGEFVLAHNSKHRPECRKHADAIVSPAVVGQFVYCHSLCHGTVRIAVREGCDWLVN